MPKLSPTPTFEQGVPWVPGHVLHTLCPASETVSPLVKPASGQPCNPPVSPHLLGSASRGFSVGILSTNSPKACQVIAESSEIDIFVVDNDRQLQKVIQVSDSGACGCQGARLGEGTVRQRHSPCLVKKRGPMSSAPTIHPTGTHKLGTVGSVDGWVWGPNEVPGMCCSCQMALALLAVAGVRA